MSAATTPRIHVAPLVGEEMKVAVEAGGGTVVDDPADADGVIWTVPFQPEELTALLEKSPARWVQLPFAGIESFFAAGAIDPDRTWTCAKGIYGPACAEHALALMLAAARCIPVHARDRKWRPGGFGSPERRLADSTVVVVGAGGIGRALIEMLTPIGVRIIAVNRSGRPVDGAERTETAAALAKVLPEADWVVVTAASTDETHHMFDRDILAAMKPEAWIVNVARGALIDSDALVEALRSGTIGGAALDVTDPEPLPDDHPLWALDNVLITPHVANTWDMAVPDLVALIERNVKAFGADRPLEGLVDPALGY